MGIPHVGYIYICIYICICIYIYIYNGGHASAPRVSETAAPRMRARVRDILSGGACTFMHVAPDMKCINVKLLRYLNHFIAISNGIISFDPLPSLLYYILL